MGSSNDLKTGISAFIAILEAIIDRRVDVLGHLGADTDKLSRLVFKGGLSPSNAPMPASKRLRRALTEIGGHADHLAKVRDVLLGVRRIASFANDVAHDWAAGEVRKRLGAIIKDVNSLLDYETRLSDKMQLLLDAARRGKPVGHSIVEIQK